MKRAFVLACVLVLGGVSIGGRAAHSRGAQGQTPSTAALQVDKIKDNLYVLRGGGGNTAAFLTSRGIVLVDTKVPGWGQPILDRLKELTDKPVTTIVNTHTHFDHVGSNLEFPATVEVVAHENTAALMKEMRPVTAGPEQPQLFKDTGGQGLPTRTFKDQMTLGTGDERVELHYFGRAHTGGDAWIVFPALRAMHSGDAFGGKGIPLIDANNGGSAVEYPDVLAKAAALANIDTIITGHHATTLMMADLEIQRDFVREFVQTVQAAKKAGKTIDDVVAAWKMPEELLKRGYMTPEEYQKLARQPMSARIRANAEIVWNETK
jgi:glyoxylase-like metal-dependent hydrolase (beta-lactamase superfamily II)